MKKISKYNYDRLVSFNWSKYENKELTTNDKIKLSKELSLINNGTVGTWKTVNKFLWFMCLESKDTFRRNSKTLLVERVTIIYEVEESENDEDFEIV